MKKSKAKQKEKALKAEDLRRVLGLIEPQYQRQTDYVSALLGGYKPDYEDVLRYSDRGQYLNSVDKINDDMRSFADTLGHSSSMHGDQDKIREAQIEHELALQRQKEDERRRLGLTTRDDNGWTDVKKLGKMIYEGATDIDPLLQLGLVNHVFGNDSVLSMYNANKQAEQAREAQREYNKMIKELELTSQYKKDRANARIEYAKLVKDYTASKDPKEKYVLKLQMQQLNDKYGFDANEDKQNIAKASDTYEEELNAAKRIWSPVLADFKTKINKAKNEKAKAKVLEEFKSRPDVARFVKAFNTNDVSELNKMSDAEKQIAEESIKYAEDYTKGVKSYDELVNDAVKSAGAAHAGKKTTEALEEKDLADKYQRLQEQGKTLTPKQEAIRKKYYN
jgi:hypothetical protein